MGGWVSKSAYRASMTLQRAPPVKDATGADSGRAGQGISLDHFTGHGNRGGDVVYYISYHSAEPCSHA